MKNGDKMVLISFRLPNALLEELDRLVEQGVYKNRSEAVRTAVEIMLERYGGDVAP